MALSRLIYVSEYKVGDCVVDYFGVLKDILEKAQKRNRERNVTGALLFDDAYFVQALEGEAADVEAIFDSITRDDRHFDLEVVEKTAVPARLFGNWWMAGLLRGGKTEALFEPYRRDGHFAPRSMTPAELLSLMQALTAAGADRQLAPQES